MPIKRKWGSRIISKWRNILISEWNNNDASKVSDKIVTWQWFTNIGMKTKKFKMEQWFLQHIE